ncbi:hypothetical protein [Dysgonomonas gadei]|uniref:HTH cro/C1-type domain-containing protein n=1 Tax=Dysgonomonas gadei ATCC BAA-286 TaxID=742766 RepID=F5IWY5_9BACT|nr:hypothetical protein [Dysgonomonas gadei]EGK02332.1 hypothetical protein HMPREF9455_01602 [Dysgonomonas gadei ATCC BAA-286]
MPDYRFTGLAYIDAANLTENNIQEDEFGQKWIRLYRQKSSVQANIPLLEVPEMILDKYKHLDGKLLPIHTNQKMNEYLKDVLITTIKNYIPKGQNPTTYIANLLNIEREYAYRRVRGETNFTIEEISLLAINLGFSVDNIIGLRKRETALLELHFMNLNKLEDIYLKKIERNSKIIKDLNNSRNSIIKWAGNTIPFALFIRYNALSKFQFYKWSYYTKKIAQYHSYSDFGMSDNLLTGLKSYSYNMQLPSHITFIIDNNFVSSVIRNIRYFYQRGLMSKIEMHPVPPIQTDPHVTI